MNSKKTIDGRSQPRTFGSKMPSNLNRNETLSSLMFGFVLALCTLHLSYAFRDIFRLGGVEAQALNAVATVTAYALFATLLLFRGFKRLNRDLVLFPMMIAFCGISVGWSIDKQETIISVLALAGCFLTGLGLNTFFGHRLPKVLVIIFIAYLLFSSIFYLLGFQITVYTAKQAAFQAFSGHKNQVGAMAGISAVLSYSLWRSGRAWAVVTLVASLVFIFIAKSSTALIAAVLACSLIEFSRLTRRSTHPRILFSLVSLVLVGVASLLVFAFGDVFLDLLGEDRTLSSRTRIWAIVLHVFNDNRLLGVGQGALWSDRSQATYLTAYLFQDTIFAQAHNGYLQLLAELGVIGFSLFIFVFLKVFFKLYEKMSINTYYTAYIALMFFIAIYNFGEATFLVGNYIIFVLLCCCAAAAAERTQGQLNTRVPIPGQSSPIGVQA